MKRYYTGPHTAVDVVIDGRTHRVARGDALEVPAHVQLGPDWGAKPVEQRPPTPTDEPATVGDDTPAEAGTTQED